MKGSFILLGCSWLKVLSTSFMFCSVKRALHLSRFFYQTSAADIVAWHAVLMSFSWLKLLSLRQDVMGSIRARISMVFKFGYARTLHSFKASISVSGTAEDECSVHCITHESLNITAWGRSPLNRLARSSGTTASSPNLTHSLGRRWRRPKILGQNWLHTLKSTDQCLNQLVGRNNIGGFQLKLDCKLS